MFWLHSPALCFFLASLTGRGYTFGDQGSWSTLVGDSGLLLCPMSVERLELELPVFVEFHSQAEDIPLGIKPGGVTVDDSGLLLCPMSVER